MARIPLTLGPPVRLGSLSDENLERLRVFVQDWLLSPERRGRLTTEQTVVAAKLSHADDSDIGLFLREIDEAQATRKRRAAR